MTSGQKEGPMSKRMALVAALCAGKICYKPKKKP